MYKHIKFSFKSMQYILGTKIKHILEQIYIKHIHANIKYTWE